MESVSSQPSELVVLVLKDVVYRHSDFRSLEDFLVERYGFNKIEEKEYKISELKKIPNLRYLGFSSRRNLTSSVRNFLMIHFPKKNKYF